MLGDRQTRKNTFGDLFKEKGRGGGKKGMYQYSRGGKSTVLNLGGLRMPKFCGEGDTRAQRVSNHLNNKKKRKKKKDRV